jgi:glycosyltransferase involved in cell wall biosynthesis/phosphoheptose isomerase
MSGMRIAMVSEHASPLATLGGADGGGQNVYVAQLAGELARLGHAVDVFTRREDPHAPRISLAGDRVRVVQVDAGPPAVLPKEALLPFMPDFAAAMRAFVAAGPGYTLIHANFFMSGLVALELARDFDLPVVITFHALGRVRRLHQKEADGFPDARFAHEDRIVAEADRIIAECPEDEADLIGLYAADPLKLRMIPCGVDTEAFRPVEREAAREALGLPATAPVILQLGRMVPRKGIDTAIEGFAAAGLGSEARLLVVGGRAPVPDPACDPELARLMAVAEASGVAERVRFEGARPRSALPLYYSAADAFVTAPWYEPFGITPLEAMACACPVVAADVGGLRYTVADGETGFLVPPRDPAAIGQRLAALVARPAAARAMGEAGRARVTERFTWRQVALQMEEVYRETRAKRAARRPAPEKPSAETALVERGFEGLAEAVARAQALIARPIRDAAELLGDVLLGGGKALVCGNGGSASDAQHFAAEFVGRFRDDDRPALPVIALNADSAFVTAWANDIGFEDVFARGVRAYGRPGDVLVAISTSGRSPNILAALHEARARGLHTIALVGGTLSPAAMLADIAVRVPATDTPRIQEVQTLVLHLLCELIEARAMAARGPAAGVHPANDGLADDFPAMENVS